jgi:hypothetical protein
VSRWRRGAKKLRVGLFRIAAGLQRIALRRQRQKRVGMTKMMCIAERNRNERGWRRFPPMPATAPIWNTRVSTGPRVPKKWHAPTIVLCIIHCDYFSFDVAINAVQQATGRLNDRQKIERATES